MKINETEYTDKNKNNERTIYLLSQRHQEFKQVQTVILDVPAWACACRW